VAFAKTLSSPPPAKPADPPAEAQLARIKEAILEAVKKHDKDHEWSACGACEYLASLGKLVLAGRITVAGVSPAHDMSGPDGPVADSNDGYKLLPGDEQEPVDPPEGKRYVCNRCGKRVNESDLSDDKTRHAVQVSTREEGNIDVDFCGPVVEEKEAGKL
jgi:hypothetical protein